MLHAILITVHAVAGALGFLLGVVLAVRPDVARSRRWALLIYLAFITVLELGLLGSVIVDWPSIDLVERIIFTLLALLGAYTVARAVLAERVSRRQGAGWRHSFIDHIGFTLISLFDGFVIVLAINLDAPWWVVGGVAVAGVAGGIWGVRRLQRRWSRA